MALEAFALLDLSFRRAAPPWSKSAVFVGREVRGELSKIQLAARIIRRFPEHIPTVLRVVHAHTRARTRPHTLCLFTLGLLPISGLSSPVGGCGGE